MGLKYSEKLPLSETEAEMFFILGIHGGFQGQVQGEGPGGLDPEYF